MNTLQFTISSIINLVVILVFLSVMFMFFFRKKSIKLLIIYTLSLILYIAILAIDTFFVRVTIATALMNIYIFMLIILLVFVYQNDLKSFFFRMELSKEKYSSVDKKVTDEELRTATDEIVKGCQTMSKSRTGALIVLAPIGVGSHILETGTELGALITAPLLECIFNTKAPFHDGAIVVKDNKVLSAGCFLPLSQSPTIQKDLGTRHRAGIGITEQTDVVTIIVSEETGVISVAEKGQLRRFITPDRLRTIIHKVYKIATQEQKRALH